MQNFWRDHVPDRFGRRDAIPPNALAVPKSVFSCATTVMDKVEGWNEKNGGFEICGTHVGLHQGRDGRGSRPEDLGRNLNPVDTVVVLFALATQSKIHELWHKIAKYHEAVDMAIEITFCNAIRRSTRHERVN